MLIWHSSTLLQETADLTERAADGLFSNKIKMEQRGERDEMELALVVCI